MNKVEPRQLVRVGDGSSPRIRACNSLEDSFLGASPKHVLEFVFRSRKAVRIRPPIQCCILWWNLQPSLHHFRFLVRGRNCIPSTTIQQISSPLTRTWTQPQTQSSSLFSPSPRIPTTHHITLFDGLSVFWRTSLVIDVPLRANSSPNPSIVILRA